MVREREEEKELKRQLYEQFALIGKALGSARRLDIIDLLAQAEYTVERLAEEADMSVANTSQHLQTLRAVRLVEVRRDGVVAYYRLSDDAVFQTWQIIQELGEDSSGEIKLLAGRLFEKWAPRDLVSFDELLTLVEEGSVSVVDVRPEREYRAGHIPGAICLPLEELAGHLPEMDKDKEVIVYCRGPYSTLADQAAEFLLAEGYSVRRLEQGFPEWRLRGLPVESGLEAVASR